jgi:hypothetical protein
MKAFNLHMRLRHDLGTARAVTKISLTTLRTLKFLKRVFQVSSRYTRDSTTDF